MSGGPKTPTSQPAKTARLRSVTPAERVKVPQILSGRALELFEEHRADLELSGRLKPEFVPLFRLFCQALAVAEQAGEGLEGVDMVGRRGGEQVSSPKFRGFRDAAALAFQLGREYGLTPASAASVKVPATPDEEARKLLA